MGAVLALSLACERFRPEVNSPATGQNSSATAAATAPAMPEPAATIAASQSPDQIAAKLFAEILDNKQASTNSPLGKFDFRNHTYPLPHGWQDPDSKEAQLKDGRRAMTEERIGLSYFTKRFFDATGDGQDEAFVFLKIDTAGSAMPLVVYVYTWRDGAPRLIWHFRTGDRADGGVKRLYVENSDLVVELYGQDRYIFNEMETLKITADKSQLCCPEYFTKNNYKWNGRDFVMQGKRLTYSLENPSAPPIENKGEADAAAEKKRG